MRKYHPLYRRWTAIRQFKYNPRTIRAELYTNLACLGLDNFQEFREFIESEIGLPPQPDSKLNRIDQNLGWIPGNVRWSPNIEVANNRRYNIIVEYQGRTQTLKSWARELGFKYDTLFTRYQRQWSVEDILTVPAEYGRKLYNHA